MGCVLNGCIDYITVSIDCFGDIVGMEQRGNGYPQEVEREFLTGADSADTNGSVVLKDISNRFAYLRPNPNTISGVGFMPC